MCPLHRCLALGLVMTIFLTLAGCGWVVPSVGYRIPGTPVSLGVGIPIPLGKSKSKSSEIIYRPLVVESTPAGAEVYVNDTLVGSTPMSAMIPFEKGVWGGAKGSAQVLLKKPGYLPQGERVFALKNGQVGRAPGGAALERLTLPLRPAAPAP